MTIQNDDITGLLGVSRIYMLTKQMPKARNHLKRMNKVAWNAIDAEDLEV